MFSDHKLLKKKSTRPKIEPKPVKDKLPDRNNNENDLPCSSSTPKKKPRTNTGKDDTILKKTQRNNVISTPRKLPSGRPITYMSPSNVVISENTAFIKLKQAQSVPSLLENTPKNNDKHKSANSTSYVPVSESNVTFRRGKAGKEHHHHGGGATTSQQQQQQQQQLNHEAQLLPRASSASNLINADSAGATSVRGKGAAPAPQPQPPVVGGGKVRGRRGGSKERTAEVTVVERAGDVGVQGKDVEKAVKNNNKPQERSSDTEELQRQLHTMAVEKSALVLQLEENMDMVADLQNEIKILKVSQEQSVQQLDQQNEENAYLRSKLRDVVHSPLSDSEKQQLLLLDGHRHHSSAPASITVNVQNDGDATACPTPDWDKHSNSNISDISVACLQDKINQMQETHYSTNEELQATLQELTDLRHQLTELHQHNARILDEKGLMFESFCRQTERLNEARGEVEQLRVSVDCNSSKLQLEAEETAAAAVQRETELVEILQRVEAEREELLNAQAESSRQTEALRRTEDELRAETARLLDRVRMLESTIDAKHAEHRQLDGELTSVRDQCNGKVIEIDRLRDLLESARTKIIELEQDRALSDKSELDELLDLARKEKDTLESEITHLREQVARSRNEIEKLREQVSVLQEECKVTRNNAKCTQSELEYKVDTLVGDKGDLIEQIQRLQEALAETEVQNQCREDDKRQLSKALADSQRDLNEAEEKIEELDEELKELKKLRDGENEEWEKFQNDLLTSVRVANDFKTEAQQDLQKIVLENKGYREKVRQLEVQIEKFKGGANSFSSKNEFTRSSLRRSLHVTPRKSEEKKVQSKEETLPDVVVKNNQLEQKLVIKIPAKSMKKDNSNKNKSVTVEASSKTEVKTNSSKLRKTRSLRKLLTEKDAEKFRILAELCAHIDPKVPFNQLSREDQSLRKLQAFYDSRELYQHRPIAKKPKDELCISNPLLNSVMANPDLKKIAEDPKLRTVEPIMPALDIKESFSFGPRLGQSKRYKFEKSLQDVSHFEDPFGQKYTTFKPLLYKSKSVNDLVDHSDHFDEDSGSLKKFLTEEDLSENFVIAPSDSKLSLNLWNGTYTFSERPTVRRDSDSSFNSARNVYKVNDVVVNRSSSFVYGNDYSLEETVEDSTKSSFRSFIGGLYSNPDGEQTKPDLLNEVESNCKIVERNDDRDCKVGQNRGNLTVVEAIVHRENVISSSRMSSAGFEYYEIADLGKDNNKDVEDNIMEDKPIIQTSTTIIQQITTSKDSSTNIEDYNQHEATSSFIETDHSYLDSIETTDNREELRNVDYRNKTASSLVETTAIRKTFVDSLSADTFSTDELLLVRKICDSVDVQRAKSDINNEDIIVIEWTNYCNDNTDGSMPTLSLEEYRRMVKDGAMLVDDEQSVEDVIDVIKIGNQKQLLSTEEKTKKTETLTLEESKRRVKDGVMLVDDKQSVEDVIDVIKIGNQSKVLSNEEKTNKSETLALTLEEPNRRVKDGVDDKESVEDVVDIIKTRDHKELLSTYESTSKTETNETLDKVVKTNDKLLKVQTKEILDSDVKKEAKEALRSDRKSAKKQLFKDRATSSFFADEDLSLIEGLALRKSRVRKSRTMADKKLDSIERSYDLRQDLNSLDDETIAAFKKAEIFNTENVDDLEQRLVDESKNREPRLIDETKSTEETVTLRNKKSVDPESSKTREKMQHSNIETSGFSTSCDVCYTDEPLYQNLPISGNPRASVVSVNVQKAPMATPRSTLATTLDLNQPSFAITENNSSVSKNGTSVNMTTSQSPLTTTLNLNQTNFGIGKNDSGVSDNISSVNIATPQSTLDFAKTKKNSDGFDNGSFVNMTTPQSTLDLIQANFANAKNNSDSFDNGSVSVTTSLNLDQPSFAITENVSSDSDGSVNMSNDDQAASSSKSQAPTADGTITIQDIKEQSLEAKASEVWSESITLDEGLSSKTKLYSPESSTENLLRGKERSCLDIFQSTDGVQQFDDMSDKTKETNESLDDDNDNVSNTSNSSSNVSTLRRRFEPEQGPRVVSDVKKPNAGATWQPNLDAQELANKLETYATLERVSVTHVLTNNLPVFGKLGGKLSEDETKFQIRSAKVEGVELAETRASFEEIRNRFLKGSEVMADKKMAKK